MTRRIFQHDLKVSPELVALLEQHRPQPNQQLGKLCSNLLADLEAVDDLSPTDRFAAKQQKLALILEAMERTGAIAINGYLDEFRSVQPPVEPIRMGHLPSSLIDHGP